MKSVFDFDPATWARLRALLDEALALAPPARADWLAALPAEHDALKPRLHSLLAGADADTAATTDDRFATLPRLSAAATQSDSVGPYRLLRLLGEGGMGTVWLAERRDMLHKRQVALKLPRDAARRPGLHERMLREREILGALNHPNIARLYDAGVGADGQPWLALELVEGEPIDRYCAAHGLDVPARLRLLLQVLAAVGHAHAQLVVHRDLKPANILVNAAGEVRLLDFGIAKLLEPLPPKEAPEGAPGGQTNGVLTDLTGRAMTLDYAAPEQLLGQPVGTAVDIYALGVVLYELLCGVRPYATAAVSGPRSRAALEAAIVQGSPPPPSARATEAALQRSLRGDLDTIVAKGMKPAPEDRYRTADAFAADIGRHLAHEPVLARPDSRRYRLGRFVARNRLAVGASAGMALTLIGGAGLATWQAQRAIAEQRRAQEVKDFAVSIFEGVNPYRGDGNTLSAVALLQQARQRVEASLVARPALRLEMLTLIGNSLANLQDMKAGETVLRDAVAAGRSSFGDTDPLMLRAREAHAYALRYAGTPQQQHAVLQTLVPQLRDQGDAMVRELVRALESSALLHWAGRELREAESEAREMLALATRRLGVDHALTNDARWLLASTLRKQGRHEEALVIAREAYPRLATRYEGNPRAPAFIDATASYGRLLVNGGDVEAGIGLQARALADTAVVFGPQSLGVGFMAANLALSQFESGALDAAQASIDRALVAMAQAPGRDSTPYAGALQWRAMILVARRRLEQALPAADEAVQAFERLQGPAGKDTVLARLDRIEALLLSEQLPQARQAFDALVADLPPGTAVDADPARARLHGALLRLSGDAARALVLHQQATDALPQTRKGALLRAPLLAEQGADLLVLGRRDEAAAVLQQALALSRQLQPHDTPARAEVVAALARTRTR
jgi:serine/threonine protein kinase/tetratricopeptide (TPR) repeat protein